jgi:hypothetical protein
MEEETTLMSIKPYAIGAGFGVDADFGPHLDAVLPWVDAPPTMLARQALNEDAAKKVAALLVARPRYIQYVGRAAEPGIVALLFAMVSQDEWVQTDMAKDAGAGELPEVDEVGLFLGVVVRYEHDFKPGLGFEDQCRDHFAAIVAGKAVPTVDKALEAMLRRG